MRFRCTIAIALMVFGISSFSRNTVFAQIRLGLHVTQEELDIWRQRAVSGPYKSAGDAGQFSPGDWDRIVANKNSFMSNPTTSANIWDGYTGTGCVPASTSLSPTVVAINLRDAAFFALVMNDSTVRNQVRDSLLVQVAKPGTDFSNSAKWCLGSTTRLNDNHPAFPAGEWLNRIILAYDYIRHDLSSENQNTIDTWFINAANYMKFDSMQNLIDSNYGNEANWLNGIFTSSAATNCGGSQGQTHINGNDICNAGKWFNNRRTHMVSFVAMAGIAFNLSSEKAWSKRFFKEYIKYHVYPDSTLNELHRSHGGNNDNGWAYAAQTFGRMIQIADTFARAGDTELYDYTTSEGGGPTAGGNKSLRTVANFYRDTTQGNLIIYNWNTSVNVANLLDGVWYPSNFWAYDAWLARGNMYWNDASFKAAYIAPGPLNKQGTSSVRDPNFSWMGPGMVYPGQLFMFGQMEDKVSPYPGTTVSTPPPPSPSTNPIAYWKFDEGVGTVAQDSSGTGNNAKLVNGAAWTTGKSGSAVSFDGLDDFVKIATTNLSTLQGTFTAWVKAPFFKSAPQYIFGHSSIPAYGNRMQLYTDETGGNLDVGLGASHTAAANVQQLQANIWHHISLTWSSGNYVVYVNGVQKTTGSYSGLSTLNSYAHIGGAGLDSDPQSWSGAIDEVKVWNRALSVTEVQNEFNSYQASPPAAPSKPLIQQ